MTSPSPLRELDGNGLEVLPREECLRRLSSGGLGRLALTDEGLPTILPVNFVFVNEQILIRTGLGAILRAGRDGEMVAFEVDASDPMYHGGLSVLVRGHARELSDAEEITQAMTAPLRAWGNAEADRFVGVSTDMVTGRRIGWSNYHSAPSKRR